SHVRFGPLGFEECRVLEHPYRVAFAAARLGQLTGRRTLPAPSVVAILGLRSRILLSGWGRDWADLDAVAPGEVSLSDGDRPPRVGAHEPADRSRTLAAARRGHEHTATR